MKKIDKLTIRLLSPALAATLSFAASAESVSEYVSQFKRAAYESYTTGEFPSVEAKGGKPISIVLDADRLKKIGTELMRSGTNREWADLGASQQVFIAEYLTPFDQPLVRRPLDYLAFWEVTSVFTEVLSQRGWYEKARLDDVELQEMGFKNLCKGPSLQSFNISILANDIQKSRFTGEAMKKAKELKERLEARKDWYASPRHQETCRQLDKIEVAPVHVSAVDPAALAVHKEKIAADDLQELERDERLKRLFPSLEASKVPHRGRAQSEEIQCLAGTKPAREILAGARREWCELSVDGEVFRHGQYLAWAASGELAVVGGYVRGVKFGQWAEFYPNGKFRQREWYQDGNLMKSQFFSEDGREVNKQDKSGAPRDGSNSRMTTNAP